MTEETSDIDRAHEATRLLMAQGVGALSVALATAAATVIVLAWISTWEDVREVGLAHYLFWPLAVAATTLKLAAHRMRERPDPAT